MDRGRLGQKLEFEWECAEKRILATAGAERRRPLGKWGKINGLDYVWARDPRADKFAAWFRLRRTLSSRGHTAGNYLLLSSFIRGWIAFGKVAAERKSFVVGSRRKSGVEPPPSAEN